MRVLAAIDGSSLSHGVVDAIASRLWEEGTEIKLVTVIEEYADNFQTRGGYHRIEHAQSHEAPSLPHQKLTQFSTLLRDKLQSQPSKILIDPVVTIGHAKERLLGLTREWQADLVVVGTHGKGALEQLFLGSVSREIMHQAMSNVHIVRPRLNSANQSIYKILLPIDHSSFSAAAVEWLVKHRWDRPVELSIITVIPEIDQLSERLSNEQDPERAAAILSQIQSVKEAPHAELAVLASEIKAKTNAHSISCAVKSGEPAAAILETAHAWQCDLILMGSHGRTGLGRLLLGSVSSKVAQSSHTSVEIVKPLALHDLLSNQIPH
jgi:nucleotide-binding universal stress UspA family protein